MTFRKNPEGYFFALFFGLHIENIAMVEKIAGVMGFYVLNLVSAMQSIAMKRFRSR
jgi:hypothetical protein